MIEKRPALVHRPTNPGLRILLFCVRVSKQTSEYRPYTCKKPGLKIDPVNEPHPFQKSQKDHVIRHSLQANRLLRLWTK